MTVKELAKVCNTKPIKILSAIDDEVLCKEYYKYAKDNEFSQKEVESFCASSEEYGIWPEGVRYTIIVWVDDKETKEFNKLSYDELFEQGFTEVRGLFKCNTCGKLTNIKVVGEDEFFCSRKCYNEYCKKENEQ